MSYQKDLDEYTKLELQTELARREAMTLIGICDYCNRSGLTRSCRLPERHRAATEQAWKLNHRLCGKHNCEKFGLHKVGGSLNYVACDDHVAEITALVASE